MIKVAVCEDSDRDLEHLRNMLSKIEIPLDVTEYANAEALLQDISQFDIFLLDIFLPEMSGVEAARRIRETNGSAVIMFLSSSEDFYREAFDLYAFQYLIKPIKPEEIKEAISRAYETIEKRREETLQITFRWQNTVLKYSDILYVSSSNHALHFFLNDGREYTSYGKLDEIEAKIKSDMFVRCHKSFVVNLAFVSRLTKEGFHIGDTIIPISRSYAASAKESYHKRLFGIFQDK